MDPSGRHTLPGLLKTRCPTRYSRCHQFSNFPRRDFRCHQFSEFLQGEIPDVTSLAYLRKPYLTGVTKDKKSHQDQGQHVYFGCSFWLLFWPSPSVVAPSKSHIPDSMVEFPRAIFMLTAPQVFSIRGKLNKTAIARATWQCRIPPEGEPYRGFKRQEVSSRPGPHDNEK